MQERQVTVDGVTHALETPFMVIATQNPIEYEGTYPLPEAQLDRFMMLLHLGYPELADEAEMIGEQSTEDPLPTLQPVATIEEVRGAITAARALYVEESVSRYTVALLRHTRADARLTLGASPRAGIAIMRIAKARALLDGRDYVIPDDVKDVAVPVLAHRLILAPEARSAGVTAEEIVADAVAAHAGAAVRAAARVLTLRGRFALVLGAAFYAVAWGFGIDEAYAVAVGLVVVVVAAFAYVRVGAGPMRFVRRAGRGEHVEGADLPVRVEVDRGERRRAVRRHPRRQPARRRGAAASRCSRSGDRLTGSYVLPGLPRGPLPPRRGAPRDRGPVRARARRAAPRRRRRDGRLPAGVRPRPAVLRRRRARRHRPAPAALAHLGLRPALRARVPARRVAAPRRLEEHRQARQADGARARGLAARRGRASCSTARPG